MDSAQSALDMINNDLKLDEEFMNQLDAIIPGKKREMVGIKANDDDDLDNTKRHTYTAHTIYDDPSAEGNNGKEALDTGESTSTPPSTSTQIPKETDYDNPDDYLNEVEDQDEDFHADKSSNNYGIPRENQEPRQSTPRQTKLLNHLELQLLINIRITIQVTIQRKSILLRLVSKGVNVHIQTIRVGMIHVIHTVL